MTPNSMTKTLPQIQLHTDSYDYSFPKLNTITLKKTHTHSIKYG